MTHVSRIPRFLAILALASTLPACDSGSDPTAPAPELPAEMGNFVSQMNAHRQSVGCPALVWNDAVAAVAQAHSRDMVDRGYFSHTNPDGESPFDRLASAGVGYSGAAENIAYGYPTGDAVLQAWLDSPGHRANIENCSLTEHGVGLEGTHWTHLFIRP
jgi:uncharacterized protein YkwD